MNVINHWNYNYTYNVHSIIYCINYIHYYTHISNMNYIFNLRNFFLIFTFLEWKIDVSRNKTVTTITLSTSLRNLATWIHWHFFAVSRLFLEAFQNFHLTESLHFYLEVNSSLQKFVFSFSIQKINFQFSNRKLLLLINNHRNAKLMNY